jgi:catechol 2,3-dioxygenase-like lactoylglutathione lyase family enzyme
MGSVPPTSFDSIEEAPLPSLKVTEINHVALHVTDLERSKRFYVDVLGFQDRTSRVNPDQAMSPHPTMSFLFTGSQGLDLFQSSSGDVHGGQEMSHMALSVEADDIDDVLVLLATAGVGVSNKTLRNTVFISDPDGHRIEILPRTANVRVLQEPAPEDAKEMTQ